MNAAEEYFMVVVQEESISRAAEKLYLSQQNLSNSIKRLEQQYGTLFVRKPRFRLTEEGEALYRTLQQIRVLENSLENRLKEIRNQNKGTIRFGIPSTRARVLLPKIMARFRRDFPHIQLELVLDDTVILEKRLLRGEIDIFLGVEASEHPEFVRAASKKDRIYLVVSEKMMEKIGQSKEKIENYEEWIGKMTFLMNPKISHLRQKTDLFFAQRNITPQKYTEVGDFELQLLLAAQAEGACFCHKMLLPKMDEINERMADAHKLQAVPIEDGTMVSDISIVRHKYGLKSEALKQFTDVLVEIIEGHF